MHETTGQLVGTQPHTLLQSLHYSQTSIISRQLAGRKGAYSCQRLLNNLADRQVCGTGFAHTLW